jgi:hypothetical protein
MKTDKRRELFLEKFKATKGNISIACEAANISRVTYYDWRKADNKFATAADDIIAGTGDFVESKLMQKISKDDTSSIIFYCKTKLKDRGYIERGENDVKFSGTLIGKWQD